MGKARMIGAFAPYTPNSKADIRNKTKLFERRRQMPKNDSMSLHRNLITRKDGGSNER